MSSDVLVIGAGIAGLRAAIEARRSGARTLIVSKSHPLSSYSITIQDGINAALGPGDSWESHAADTIRAGDELGDREVVDAFCQEAPDTIRELDRMGVPFNRAGADVFAQVKLAGSEQARACSVYDMTGHALTQVLYEQALREGIEFLEEWYVIALVEEDGRCRGAVAIDLATGKMDQFSASAVVLAAGGIRRLYEHSTSSRLCTADGISLAYRAGAQLVDMEMVQYHPSVLKNSRLALSELLFGQGAELLMADERPLAPVSGQPWAHALARSAAQEIAAGRGSDGHLLLKSGVTPEEAESVFFMTNSRLKMFLKADLANDNVSVAPGMHRLLGGVATDANGATSLKGLFAAGECAGNGFHGAGALDGNGLLASAISGKRAGHAAAGSVQSAMQVEASRRSLTEQEGVRRSLLTREVGEDLTGLRRRLAAMMHEHVGMARDGANLSEAARQVAAMRMSYYRAGLKNKDADFNFELLHHCETGTLIDTAEVIIAAAAARQESRGVHQRTDFPERNDNEWSKRLRVERVNGAPQVRDFSAIAPR